MSGSNSMHSSSIVKRNDVNQFLAKENENVVNSCKISLCSSPFMTISLLVKLDDETYMILRDQLLTYVTSYGLEWFIDGSLIQPPNFLVCSMSLNSTFLNWSRLNSIVKRWIYGSISITMLGYLSSGMITQE